MYLKWIGAILVVCGCAGFGFYLAANYRKQEQQLRQLMNLLQFMASELEFSQRPLPELIEYASHNLTGQLRRVFEALSEELHRQVCPDAVCCMQHVLGRIHDIPFQLEQLLSELGQSLGHFDLQGQLSAINAVMQHCKQLLDEMIGSKDIRTRNYQTLGLCAGIALAILFI